MSDLKMARPPSVKVVRQPSDEFESGAKRFRVPLVVEATCPVCGETFQVDYTRAYFCYPVLNGVMTEMLGHGDRVDGSYCGGQVRVDIVLRLTVELVDPA